MAKDQVNATAQKCYHIIVSVFNRKNAKTGYGFKAYATKIGKNADGKDIWADVSFCKEINQDDIPQNDCELIVPESLINSSTKNGYKHFWIHGWKEKFDVEKPLEDLDQYFESEELPF